MAAIPQRRRGSGFVNLSKYLQASKGSPLEQKVASGISGVGEQARTGLTSALEQHKQGVAGGLVGSEADVKRREDLMGQAQRGEDIDEQESADFKRFREGQYKGPEDLGGQAQELGGRAKEAETLGRQVSEEGGRLGLLQRFVGGPQYTRGAQKLDEVILGRAKGGYLPAAQRAVAGVGQEVQKGTDLARALSQQAKGQTESFTSGAKQGVTQGLTGLESAIQDKVRRENEAREQAYVQAQQTHSGFLTPQQRRNYGLQEGFIETYNVDPRTYLAKAQQLSQYNIASPQEQAQYEALSRLSGQANAFLPKDIALQGYDASKPFQFDTQRFLGDVEANRRGYFGEVEGTKVTPKYWQTTDAGQKETPLMNRIQQLEAIIKDYDDKAIGYKHSKDMGGFHADKYNNAKAELGELVNQLTGIKGKHGRGKGYGTYG